MQFVNCAATVKSKCSSPIQLLKSSEQKQLSITVHLLPKVRGEMYSEATLEKGIADFSFETERTVDVARDEPRSFDIAASVYMFRYDLQTNGSILPETYQQALNEELTYISEGIDRHSHTSFTLQEREELGIVLFQKGEWRSYKGMLMTGLEIAKKEAENDHRKKFLADWAARDLQVGESIQNLKSGEATSWQSVFPEKERQMYGDEFMTECGLQPKRKMGFIYRAERNQNGSITLEAHTIDNSDPDAFNAVEQLLRDNPQANIESQLEAYDDAMFLKTGKVHKAGRLEDSSQNNDEAYEFVKQNTALIEYYFEKIKWLAESSLTGNELRQRKERLTYGVWARIKELLNEEQPQMATVTDDLYGYSPLAAQPELLASQIDRAYHRASLRNEVMAGCGGSVKGLSFDGLSPEEVFDSIFTDVEKKKELSWHGGHVKRGTCVNCHEGPKDVGVKSWCKDCISGHCG